MEAPWMLLSTFDQVAFGEYTLWTSAPYEAAVVAMLQVKVDQHIPVEPVDRDCDEDAHVDRDENVFKKMLRHKRANL